MGRITRGDETLAPDPIDPARGAAHLPTTRSTLARGDCTAAAAASGHHQRAGSADPDRCWNVTRCCGQVSDSECVRLDYVSTMVTLMIGGMLKRFAASPWRNGRVRA